MIWAQFGTGEFPLTQPMVGQDEFFYTFKNFTGKMKDASMATVFPLIGHWGVGKSRIGFELIAEALGQDKDWILYDGADTTVVRVFDPGLQDGVLPIYIRYTHMAHDDLMGDTWIGYGTYKALAFLARDPDNSIQGKIIAELHNALKPRGFSVHALAGILRLDDVSDDDLLAPGKRLLDELIENAMNYLRPFGLNHLLVICDEVETATEIANFGLDPHESISRLDDEAIRVITSGIKHEDARKKYPFVTFLLLCSPVIGHSIEGLGALDRRTERCDITQNAFSDIHAFIGYLKKQGRIPDYPTGLVEAAYAIAGGNFGWFNVIMAEVDQHIGSLAEENGAPLTTGGLFKLLLKGSKRFRDSLIDSSSFDYIQCPDRYRPDIMNALLSQLPVSSAAYAGDLLSAMRQARAEDGEEIFKDFYCVTIKKDEVGAFLADAGYQRVGDDMFAGATGETFDLKVMLQSLKTFSIRKPDLREHEYLICATPEGFYDQIGMLYPDDGAQDAVRSIFAYAQEHIQALELTAEYVGVNFAYLKKLNKRYKTHQNQFGYVKNADQNQAIEERMQELRAGGGEAQRVLQGFARALEKGDPEIAPFTIDDVACLDMATHTGPYLDAHPKNTVTLIWGKDESKLEGVLSAKRLLSGGLHPIFVISDTVFSDGIRARIMRKYEKGVAPCLIFLALSRLQKENLDALALGREWIDIGVGAKQRLTTAFHQKIDKLHDYIMDEAAKWFRQQDEQGRVLRPLIYKPAQTQAVPVLARAFQRMLVHGANYHALGSDPRFDFSSTDYEELASILAKSIDIGRLQKNKGYRSTGLFRAQDDEDYAVTVIPAMRALLRFIDVNRKDDKNILNAFFFSCADKVKPPKIVEQWKLFFIELGLIRKTDGFVERIARQDLQNTLSDVTAWFERDYEEALQHIGSIIKDSGALKTIKQQYPDYQKKLREAAKLLNQIGIEKFLQADDADRIWKEQLGALEAFNKKVTYIFNRQEYDAIRQYSPSICRTLRLDDLNANLWFRIRHVTLFLEYIDGFKTPAVEAIDGRIADIRAEAVYKEYVLPISPVINILERYKAELQYATDNATASTSQTMVETADLLSHKLLTGKYNEAIERLRVILERLGFDEDSRQWQNSGIMAEYAAIRALFTKLADFLEGDIREARQWRDYFDGSRDLSDRASAAWNNLNHEIDTLTTYMEAGLDQEIEELEDELRRKPDEFIEALHAGLNAKSAAIEIINGRKATLINAAIDERNRLCDQPLIAAIDKIRRVKNEEMISHHFHTEQLPEEQTFSETRQAVKQAMQALEQEGAAYFDDTCAKTTFGFFKKVVAAQGNLDWSDLPEEQQELERLRLIRIKVEVV